MKSGPIPTAKETEHYLMTQTYPLILWITILSRLGNRLILAGCAPLLCSILASPAYAVVAGLADPMSGEPDLMTHFPTTFAGANINDLIGAQRFYDAGFYGQNSITANIEAGKIWDGHETLTHVTEVVADPSVTPQYDRHATWVGSIIGGRLSAGHGGEYQRGIAYGTDLRSGVIATNWNAPASTPAYSGSFNITSRSYTTVFASLFGVADVVNASWSGNSYDGSDFIASVADGLARQNPGTTFVVSAGNSGPAANTVGTPASGYNHLVVGALQNDGQNHYDRVANFSSRGPSDYFDPVHGVISRVRADVDLVAPGSDLTAAYYGGQSGGNASPWGAAANVGPNFYSVSVAGTSFSAPIVAGAAALLDSASRNTAALAGDADSRDARVVKAVLMNSADKITGWNNGQTSNNGLIKTEQSLDYSSGAGALNLDQAFDQYIDAGTRNVSGLGGGMVANRGWDFGQVQLHNVNSYVFDRKLIAGETMTVTLDWFRDRSFDPGSLATTDHGQADLNLYIRELSLGGLIAESVSIYNLTEHLFFKVPKTSRYQIEVRYGANLFGSMTEESYGIAWNVVPVPPGLLLLISGLLGMLGWRVSARWQCG